MKHLLNNISQEEKNRILEQHKGGKSIDTTRFKALLESKSGNVKPLIMERDPRAGTPPNTPVSGNPPNTPPVSGTRPNTPRVSGNQPTVNVYPQPTTSATSADTSNWVKVIAYGALKVNLALPVVRAVVSSDIAIIMFNSGLVERLAVKANDAVVANEAVPNNEPVILPLTLREPVTVKLPLTSKIPFSKLSLPTPTLDWDTNNALLPN